MMTEQIVNDETIMKRLRNLIAGFVVFTAVLAIGVTAFAS
jgi:hypothetical protein